MCVCVCDGVGVNRVHLCLFLYYNSSSNNNNNNVATCINKQTNNHLIDLFFSSFFLSPWRLFCFVSSNIITITRKLEEEEKTKHMSPKK